MVFIRSFVAVCYLLKNLESHENQMINLIMGGASGRLGDYSLPHRNMLALCRKATNSVLGSFLPVVVLCILACCILAVFSPLVGSLSQGLSIWGYGDVSPPTLKISHFAGGKRQYTLFFYKEPVYKEPTCRRPKYLKNLYY